MKAVVLVVPAEQAEEVARLIAATLSLNGWAHNEPSVIDWPQDEKADDAPFSMPCGWSGWDLNQHKLMHQREDDDL